MNRKSLFFAAASTAVALFSACSFGPQLKDGAVISTTAGSGSKIRMECTRGGSWLLETKMGMMNLRITPQFAVWVEDSAGKATTLMVTNAFAKQDWKFAKINPDTCGRPMCMPYWLNRIYSQNQPLPTKNKPLPDAVTGATPAGSFLLNTQLPEGLVAFKLYVEINKSFDNNEAWPASKDMSSFNGQPPVVYAADINLADTVASSWKLLPVGMSGVVGHDPVLYPVDSKLTTALDMLKEIVVTRQ